ncbi:hypothetical protein KIL84_003662 [Mauremys mutica]|uniref:Uncharacterized protein n=1 Tax=Mauremys mutica TaxID=74926 RepID=A0A9D4ARQ1_9SAUR|nr:hypothetical protein KIL84_003662 [Mauremys mutica]
MPNRGVQGTVSGRFLTLERAGLKDVGQGPRANRTKTVPAGLICPSGDDPGWGTARSRRPLRCLDGARPLLLSRWPPKAFGLRPGPPSLVVGQALGACPAPGWGEGCLKGAAAPT